MKAFGQVKESTKRMKSKLNYIIIMLLMLVSCQVSCQNSSIINDLYFLNFSSHPKKITETRTFSSSKNFIGKDEKINKSVNVFYFTKDGFLTKVINYTLSRDESLNEKDIYQINKYNSRNKGKRYFRTTMGESGAIIAEGYLEKISDSLYTRVSESKIFNTTNDKLFYFDKNNRIKKTEHTGFLYSSELNNVEHYTYTDNLLTEINSEDFITQINSKTIIKNRKLDQRGNPIYEELYDENDTLKQKVERIFEYY